MPCTLTHKGYVVWVKLASPIQRMAAWQSYRSPGARATVSGRQQPTVLTALTEFGRPELQGLMQTLNSQQACTKLGCALFSVIVDEGLL